MSVCGVCLKGAASRAVKITCCGCAKLFHGNCVGLSREDVDFIVSENEVWRCSECSKERRKSMLLETSVSSGKITLEDIYEMLKTNRDEQKNAEKQLGESIQFCHAELERVNETLARQSDEMLKFRNDMDSIKKENQELKKEIIQLKSQVEVSEQYSRKNCLEIQGVPFQRNEDPLEIVKLVGKAIDFDINVEMIDACHRLSNVSSNVRVPGLIVKFVRNIDKEEFLRKKKVKRELSTRHLGLHSDSAIYINESLSPARRKLYNAAREVKRSANFKFIWLRQGKILMRREEGSTVYTISCEEDLKLIK